MVTIETAALSGPGRVRGDQRNEDACYASVPGAHDGGTLLIVADGGALTFDASWLQPLRNPRERQGPCPHCRRTARRDTAGGPDLHPDAADYPHCDDRSRTEADPHRSADTGSGRDAGAHDRAGPRRRRGAGTVICSLPVAERCTLTVRLGAVVIVSAMLGAALPSDPRPCASRTDVLLREAPSVKVRRN